MTIVIVDIIMITKVKLGEVQMMRVDKISYCFVCSPVIGIIQNP